ncbi:MAG TPA: DUF1800 family protein [Caulobacteraceae bacterium]|jgi:uncharacterized protein (DUF1800 family)|nr:DUF1800 family protein [Caulobacteraceae bacterium]
MAANRDLDAAIAVTRFGLGARPGEIAEAKADPRGWLHSQVIARGADQPTLNGAALPGMRERFDGFKTYQVAVRNAGADMDARKAAAQSLNAGNVDEMLARFQLASTTPAGFRERWTLFWANHFTVAAKAPQVAIATGPFEREAIRPHVFGRFETLLGAASRHPGMLLYLDQAQSAGPDSQAGRNRKLGLNENLAREIMELHTVGADAGYTQADVTEFARALTGWSMGGLNAGADQGAYIYRAVMHEPGPRQIMGRRYGDGQEEQGAKVLADLANHPATAAHIARKLAIHFVADEPPPPLTARLEKAFRDSRGDLAMVAEALIAAPEAWDPAQAKLKTPYEFLVSGYRAAAAAPSVGPREVAQPLTLLGQRPFGAPQPNGWSDLTADWAAPDAIVKRLGWARAFSARYAPMDPPVEVADAALGAQLSTATHTAVSRAESRDEAFALLLMSPEFQRR